MPIRYRIFPESRVLVTRYLGHVTERDLLDTYGAIYAQEDYERCRVELVDVRHRTVSDYTMSSFMTLNEMTIERFGRDAKDLVTAILAGKDSELGMANLYRAVTDVFGNEEVATFTNAADALEWLSIPKASRLPVVNWIAEEFVAWQGEPG